jgi:hypothetical protein
MEECLTCLCFFRFPDKTVGEEIGIDIAASIRHSKYDEVTNNNDIMLLKLERGTNATDHIIVNANDAFPSHNQEVRVIGWVSTYRLSSVVLLYTVHKYFLSSCLGWCECR